jgi:hypothetical protein
MKDLYYSLLRICMDNEYQQFTSDGVDDSGSDSVPIPTMPIINATVQLGAPRNP